MNQEALPLTDRMKGRDWLMTQDWADDEIELVLETANQLKTDFKTGDKKNIAGEKSSGDSSGKDSSGASATPAAAKTGTSSSDGGSSGKSTATS